MSSNLQSNCETAVDNFASGGGPLIGIEFAAGRVHVATNHSPLALAIHRAEHTRQGEHLFTQGQGRQIVQAMEAGCW